MVTRISTAAQLRDKAERCRRLAPLTTQRLTAHAERYPAEADEQVARESRQKGRHNWRFAPGAFFTILRQCCAHRRWRARRRGLADTNRHNGSCLCLVIKGT